MIYPDYLVKAFDWNWYVRMAEGRGPIMSPYCYRVLTPWLVSLLPFETELSFLIINGLASIAATVFFMLWLRKKFGFDLAMLATVIWVLMPHHPLRQTISNIGVDPLATALIMLGFWAVETKRFLVALSVSVIAPLARECVLVVPLYYWWKNGGWEGIVVGLGAYGLILVNVKPLHIEVPTYFTGSHLTMLVNLKNPFNLTAALWNAFGPVAFVGILGWRKNKDLTFLACVVAAAVFAGGLNRERFLNWFPVLIPMALLYVKGRPKLRWMLLGSLIAFVAMKLPILSVEQHQMEMVKGWLWPQKVYVTVLALAWFAAFKTMGNKEYS